MSENRALLVVLVVTLGSAALWTSIATAKTPSRPRSSAAKLLPKRTCEGLLDLADFPGAIREGGTTEPRPTFYGSLCSFVPPEPTEVEPEPQGLASTSSTSSPARPTCRSENRSTC